MQRLVLKARAAKKTILLVPTMGALHSGHGSLITEARERAGKNGLVIVSIYVNPTQFGPKEDLARYPRPLKADLALCRSLGADIVFHPESLYAEGHSTWVNEDMISRDLCGASRPGHFQGVCTVVLKLFLITQPHVAVFGRKDAQQCMVIQRMVRDMNVPVRLIFAPTVRESDGLALSSRNVYLSPEERSQALVLSRALAKADAAWRGGERSAARLRQMVARVIATAPLARVDYITLVDGTTMQPAKQAPADSLSILAVAVFFGSTRLIDNVWLQ